MKFGVYNSEGMKLGIYFTNIFRNIDWFLWLIRGSWHLSLDSRIKKCEVTYGMLYNIVIITTLVRWFIGFGTYDSAGIKPGISPSQGLYWTYTLIFMFTSCFLKFVIEYSL